MADPGIYLSQPATVLKPPLYIVSSEGKQDFPKFHIFLKHVHFLILYSSFLLYHFSPFYLSDNCQCCLSYVCRGSFAALFFWGRWSASCLLLCQKPLENMQQCLSANYLAACTGESGSKRKQTCLRSDNDLYLELCLPWVLLFPEEFLFCLWCGVYSPFPYILRKTYFKPVDLCKPSFNVLYLFSWDLLLFFFLHFSFIFQLLPKKFSSASLLDIPYFCIVIKSKLIIWYALKACKGQILDQHFQLFKHWQFMLGICKNLPIHFSKNIFISPLKIFYNIFICLLPLPNVPSPPFPMLYYFLNHQNQFVLPNILEYVVSR